MPRIELGLQDPQPCVLPLYDIPVGPPGIEPGLHPPEGCVLPVYYGPIWKSYFGTKSAGAPCKDRTYGLSDVNGTLYNWVKVRECDYLSRATLTQGKARAVPELCIRNQSGTKPFRQPYFLLCNLGILNCRSFCSNSNIRGRKRQHTEARR